MSALPTIEELNALDEAGAVAALRPLFEDAPVLFSRVNARRPFRSYAELLAAARDVAFAMSEPEQTALLATHPRIGAPRATLSDASVHEQGHADADVAAELAALQDEYERHFGFRFVVFVAGRSRAEVVTVLRARLARTRQEELRTGLVHYLEIAADRLDGSS